jgi:hypothetical protein
MAVRTSGVPLVLVTADDRRAECRAAVALVRRLTGQGGTLPGGVRAPLPPERVGVLYPRLPVREEVTLQDFVAELGASLPVVWLRDWDRDRVADPGVKVQTVHSAKGLQYTAVVLLWADLFPAGFADTDPAAEARLMYVALTRAEDYLYVLHSGDSPFVRTIRESWKARLLVVSGEREPAGFQRGLSRPNPAKSSLSTDD